MLCPTCSSPLPDGAMFCGQCGRAITAADVAAHAEARDAAGSQAGPDAAAWSLKEPPVASVPVGTPWWVDGRVEAADAETPAPQGSADGAPASDGTPASHEAHEANSIDEAEGIDDVVSPTAARPTVGPPASDESPAAESVSEDAPAAVPPAAVWPTPVVPAPSIESTPLRAPGSVGAPAGRPASVPLWTASITPITADTAEGESPTDESPTDTASGDVAEDAPHVAPADAAPEPSDGPLARAEEPRDGDTNVIAPLVAPGTSELGSRHRCSVCGATLTDDDIFCPECGTVVEAVAQSFTGPITPILTGPVAPAPPRPVPSGEGGEGASNSRAPGGEPREPTPAPRQAPLAPTPLTPAPGVGADTQDAFVPDPEPKKRRRLFSRRAKDDTPELWAGVSAGPPPPRPEAPPVAAMPSMDVNPVPTSKPEPSPSATAEVHLDEVPPAAAAPPPAPSPAPLAATPVAAPDQAAEPVIAPVPPAPASDRPNPWRVNLGAPTDDLENTRIVDRRPPGEPFILQFSTGESFTVQGSGLVGRAPMPQPGEAIDLLVRIFDPGRSVSKTHLEFGQADGMLWVSDRWSGNGTVVTSPTGTVRRGDPGKRVVVSRGSRVEIGEQFFIVS